MKTKDFTSDAEVAELVDAFEKATIPASEFSHLAHIAVALSYLETMSQDRALAQMREKIRVFAAHHGASNLYHETLTTFWMKLLAHLDNNYDVDVARRGPAKTDSPLYQRINEIVARWGTRAPVDAHYTRELITSQAAREKWIEPDRLPLPF